MGLMKKTLSMPCYFKASDSKMINALSSLSDMGKTDTLNKIDISMKLGIYKELTQTGIYKQ